MTSEGQELRSLILSVAIHGGALVVIAAALHAHGPFPKRATWVPTELGSADHHATLQAETETDDAADSSQRRFAPVFTTGSAPGEVSESDDRSEYATVLRKRIDAAIRDAAGEEPNLEGEVVLDLEIDATGQVVAASASQSSPELAVLVRAAAREASPFPAPRPEWLDTQTGRLKIRLPVRFESN